MGFYDHIGEKYDMMIRWNNRIERETPFFQRLFSENRVKRVLDLGCGTGHHAKLFANWGCEVVGVDASPVLLEIAKKGIDPDSENQPRYIESDFLSVADKVEGPFDAILSLGNTLAHVQNVVEMASLLSSLHSLLKPGGVFVFQNRNYDRLISTRERFLFPSTYRVADNEQIFFRFNDFEGDKVRFNVVHFSRVGESWIHDVQSTELTPWQQSDISELMKRAGFVAMDFYGDFSGTPFDAETSTDLVVLSRKSIAKE